MTTFTEPRPCIVVGFNDSPASHIALARAIERVGSTGKLYLVHAWQPPDAWLGPARRSRGSTAGSRAEKP